MGFKKFSIFIITFLLVIFGVELISFLFLLSKDKQESFLIKKNKTPLVWEGKYKAYNTIDPLLGWAIDKDTINSRSYTIEHGSILLESDKFNFQDSIKIYISGGSTSDVIFDSLNWPVLLLKLFEESNISAKIYVASVGGYNSGQELLKTLRDIDDINPDFHISYSGANEADNGSYVSNYEQELYESFFYKNLNGILPNFKKLFLNKNIETTVNHRYLKDNFVFWANNLDAMHALSIQKKYNFIGVLQPVINYGSKVKNTAFDKQIIKNYIDGYNRFYPNAMLHADSINYVLNFTDIFKAFSTDLIFSDDCHLIDVKYQKIVAQNIFNKILELENAKK